MSRLYQSQDHSELASGLADLNGRVTCVRGKIYFLGSLSMIIPGDFPGGLEGKESACNAGDLSSISWVGKIPCRNEWQPTPVFLTREPHEQRSLASYSPWGHRGGHG